MKMFLAVFFGVLAAAIVIALGWRLYTHARAAKRAATVRSQALAVASACSVKGYDGSLDDELESDLNVYQALLKQAGEDSSSVWMKREIFMNDLVAKGCLKWLHPNFGRR